MILTKKEVFFSKDTNYFTLPKVGSLSYAQEITVDGKVESGDKRWLVLKTSDGTTQMVSASLVSQTKPSTNTNTGNSGNGNTGNGNTGNTQQPQQPQQPSGGNQPSGGGQQPPADDGFDPGSMGLPEWGQGGVGSGGGSGLNWTTD